MMNTKVDNDFYGRLFSELTLYLYLKKPERDWLILLIYPSRSIEKKASIEFLPFLNLPQVHRKRLILDVLALFGRSHFFKIPRQQSFNFFNRIGIRQCFEYLS